MQERIEMWKAEPFVHSHLEFFLAQHEERKWVKAHLEVLAVENEWDSLLEKRQQKTKENKEKPVGVLVQGAEEQGRPPNTKMH